MKARVKATGKVIEVMNVMDENGEGIWENMSDVSTNPTKYHNYELEFIDLPKGLQHNEPNYWEKLKHQYAGMAMQGLLSDNVAMEQIVYNQEGMIAKIVANFAVTCATALIEKLKNEQL